MPTSVTGVIPTAEEYNDLVSQEELTAAIGTLSSAMSSSSGGTLIGTTSGTVEARFAADEARAVHILAPSAVDPEAANEGDQYFNTTGNLNKIYRAGAWVINDSADLALELASENGSSLVNHRGRTVQNVLDSAQVGKDVVPGYPNEITAIPTTYPDMTDKSLAIPNGSLISKNPILYTEIPAIQYAFKRFQLRGQGKYQSILNLVTGTSTGTGWQVRARGFEYGEIKGLGFDSTGLNNTGNGTASIEQSKYFDISNVYINGGYDFSAYMDQAYACRFDNIHVRGQRHWNGNAKASLLTGGYSTFCRINNSVVDSHALDGTLAFFGDLMDSDNASHGFFVGNTLIGPTAAERSSGACCLYSEGQEARSNVITGFNACYANGVAIASTELAIMTAIGNSYTAQQLKGVWNRNLVSSIGCQYSDMLFENGDQYQMGAYHIDNGTFGCSVGDVFSGNRRDFSDYSGISAADTSSLLTIGFGSFSTLYQAYIGTSREQISIIGSRRVTESADSLIFGGGRNFAVIIGGTSKGPLGNFGANSVTSEAFITGETINGADTTSPMLKITNQGRVIIEHCVIKKFGAGLLQNTPTNILKYRNTTFVNVVFSDIDKKQAYIDCVFINCTNQPLNVSAGSFSQPEQFKFEYAATSGESLVIPDWLVGINGICHIVIEGSNGNGHGEYIIRKQTASSNIPATGAIVVFESTAGLFSITWPADSRPVISFTNTLTYRVRFY
ncbi:hypothetical protein [Sodalis sp. RH22]|uniref:hypothetical protein n=1 Tax=unclassified Sodalis (in: enterobacteria) TaxID=2636512 RepID=UPI0039B3D46A